MSETACRLDIALLHHPVLNKAGETIGSAVTNLDLHDLARAARTYGVGRYYLATPYEDQHELVAQIIGHWQDGYGAVYNPARKEALAIISPAYSLDEIVADVRTRRGQTPLLVATSARPCADAVGYREMRDQLEHDRHPVLLLFGTAHGLAPQCLARADKVLQPIRGRSPYNHLSVRSAVAIVLDRLLGAP